LSLGRGDVEGVHRYALFGADPGVCGVQTVLVDGVEEALELRRFMNRFLYVNQHCTLAVE
jgi:hypothetical protein